MKVLNLLLCLTAAPNLFADGQEYLQLGKTHRLLGDKVRVRAKADTKAAVIAELPVGSIVNPIEQTTEMHTQDGIEAPWYKVSFTKGGEKTEGYIWGNLIAKGYGTSKDGFIFLYGIGRGKKEAGGSEMYTTQLRAVKDGKEVTRLDISEGVSFQSRAEVKTESGRGFTGVSNIISIRFNQEYCGGKGNKLYIFWDGSKLTMVHSTADGFDAPAYAVEKQTFPDEKGGKKDQLYVVREQDDSDDPKSKNFDKFWLKWNGKKLVKAP